MNRAKYGLVVFLLLAGLNGLFAQQVVEAIVAIVNDDIITLTDYKRQHDLLYQQLRAQVQGEDFNEQFEMARNELLEVMITSLLLLQKARELGVDSTEQLNMYIDSIKQENGFSDAQLMAAFQQQGIDFEQWKAETRERFLRDAVVYAEVGRSIVIDDAEIFTYYRQHPEEFTQPPEFHIKGIFVSGESRSSGEADQLKQEIEGKLTGGENFSELAAEYSEGPEKENQGDMGSYQEGQMLSDFEKEIKILEAGGTTPWIPIQTGWYKLRLEEKTDSRLLPFEEVRDQVQQKIYTERNAGELDKYLKDLKARSFIKILIPEPQNQIIR